MIKHHVESLAAVTVGCIEVPRMEATGFGVMHVDADDNIIEFVEKPTDPPAIPGHPDLALASMGIYVFETEYMFELLREDAANSSSSHDFGKDLIPHIVQTGKKAIAHPFQSALPLPFAKSERPSDQRVTSPFAYQWT